VAGDAVGADVAGGPVGGLHRDVPGRRAQGGATAVIQVHLDVTGDRLCGDLLGGAAGADVAGGGVGAQLADAAGDQVAGDGPELHAVDVAEDVRVGGLRDDREGGVRGQAHRGLNRAHGLHGAHAAGDDT